MEETHTLLAQIKQRIAAGLVWLAKVFVFLIPVLPTLSVKLLVVGAMLVIFITDTKQLMKSVGRSWDILLFLTVGIIGLANTDDLMAGARVLETNFSLLGLAILLTYPVIERQRDELLLAFALGTTTASLMAFGLAFVSFADSGDFSSFFYYNLTAPIGSHPTYFAYYLILSITWLLYWGLRTGKKMAVQLGWVIFLLVFLVLTGGRTAFLSLLLVFSYFFLRRILDPTERGKWLLLGQILTMVAILFAMNWAAQRFVDEHQNDAWNRIELWYAALSANPSPIVGVGTGDSKPVLMEYLNAHGLTEYVSSGVNSHNQFLETYLANGAIGLLVLLVILIRPLAQAFRSGHTLGIVLYYPVVIYAMTEVVLGRYQGVVLLAFIHRLVIAAPAASSYIAHPTNQLRS